MRCAFIKQPFICYTDLIMLHRGAYILWYLLLSDIIFALRNHDAVALPSDVNMTSSPLPPQDSLV